MSFKKVTASVFTKDDRTDFIAEYTLLKGRDKRPFTREVAKEYLGLMKLDKKKESILIRVANNGHLFVRGER